MIAFFRASRLMLAISAALLFAPSAQAQTFNWTNAAGGNWNVPTNWSGAGPTFGAGIDETLSFSGFNTSTAPGYTATNNIAGGAFTRIINFNNTFGSPLIAVTNNSTLTFNAAGGMNPELNLNGFGLAQINQFTLGVNSPFTIGGSGLGTLSLTGAITNTNNNQVTINQTGGGFLGTGATVILNAGSNFGTSGTTVVNSGNVALRVSSSLGSSAANTIVVNGGTFRHHDVALVAVQNNWLLNSNLEFRIASADGTVDSLNGVLSGSGGINMHAGQNFQLLLRNTNTFSGDVVGRGSFGYSPVFTLASNSGQTLNGSILNVDNISLSTNATLQIENINATTTAVNRIKDTANVTLNRANVLMLANATLAGSETFGTLTSNGSSAVILSPGNSAATFTGAGSNLTTANWVRNNLATAQITAPNLGNAPGPNVSSWTITNNPGGDIGGILPYAIANPATTATVTNTFVRYDTNTMRLSALNLATDYQAGPLPVFLNSSTGAQYRQTATQAGLSGSRTVNSLILDTNGAAPQFIMNGLTGTGTLNVTSGAVLSSTFGGISQGAVRNTIGVANLNFGANPGYFHTRAPSSLLVTSTIAGTAGISTAGGGDLVLFGNNTFSGHIHNQFGNIVVEKDANLGDPSNEFRMYGGFTGLTFLPNPLYTTGSALNFNTARNIVVGGAGGVITVVNTNTRATVTGTISGAGYLAKAGGGTLVLDPASGANTFQGRLQMQNGVTMVRNEAAMGAAGVPIEFVGTGLTGSLPVLQPMASFTTSRNILTNATGSTGGTAAVFFTNGFNLQLDGVIGTQNHITGQNISKHGFGDLIFTNANTYNGTTNMGSFFGAIGGQVFASAGENGTQTGGRLVMQGPNGSAALSTSFTLNPGTALVLDNSAAVNNFRVGMVPQFHIGSELNLIGNAANGSNVTQAIGAYSSNNVGSVVSLVQNASPATNNVTTLRIQSYGLGFSGAPITFFRGTNLGGASGDRSAILFNTSPAIGTSGILTSAVGATTAGGAPTDFVTVTGGALQMFSGYVANNPNAGALAVTDINTSAGGVLGSVSTVGAARISGAGAVDLAGFNWTIGDGHILSTVAGGTTIANSGTAANLALGAAGRITNATPLTIGAGVTITGTAVNKYGDGMLTINQGGSTTATWAVSQGTLRYGAGVVNALPSNAAVTLAPGASLDLNNNTGVTLANIQGFGNVNVGSNGLTLGTNSTVFMGSFQGSGPITLNGAGDFTVSGNTSGFTGNWHVNAGTLRPNSNTALGSGTIHLGASSGSATAQLAQPGNDALTTISNPIVVTPGGTGVRSLFFGFGTSGAPSHSVNLTGNITHNGTALLNLVGFSSSSTTVSGAQTISGNITGTGPMAWDGGNWNLNGDNSGYSGAFEVRNSDAMVLGIGSNTALGTGLVTVNSIGGILRADGGARTLVNNIRFIGSVNNNFGVTGLNDMTFNGTVLLASPATNHNINVISRGTTIFTGVISGIGTLESMSKTGFGDLVLSGANTFQGGFTLNSGALGFGSDTVGAITSGPVGRGTFTINSPGSHGAVLRAVGGQRTVNNPITVNGDFVVDGSNALTLGGAMNFGAATRTAAITNSALTTFAGNITGTGGLTKEGAGTLVFAAGATNSFQGVTNINRGTLQVNGMLDSNGTQVNVNNLGTLSGTGSIARNVTAAMGGTIKPGTSPGILTVGGNVAMQSGSAFGFQYLNTMIAPGTFDMGNSATPGIGNNKLTVNGTLDVQSGSIFKIEGNFADFTPNQNYSFLVGSGTTVTPFNFDSVANPAQFDTSALIGYNSGSFLQWRSVGGNVYFNMTPVPEPAFILLAGSVGLGVYWRRRRRVS